MSAVATYRLLHQRALVGLLGQWVSELEPVIFHRVDVSPQVLAIVGIGAPGDAGPRMSAEITVTAMIAAGALDPYPPSEQPA